MKMFSGKILGKRVLACILCLLLAFGMVACGGSENNSENNSEKPNTEESQASESNESEQNSEPAQALEHKLSIAINVMYNDIEKNYFGNEIGEVIEITEDGQYTITFDCSKNLSEDAKTAGITGLNNLTAIYLKDYACTTGELSQSNLTTCNIRWDKVVVDGQELTVTNSEFKSGIKSSNIFDTNDPINSWDGSAVEEVTTNATDHVVNMNLENPQVITITFTISDLVFAQ